MTDVVATVCWLGRRVRERASGRIGKVTADLPEDDLIAVFFGLGAWNTYTPNAWSKANLFEVIGDADDRHIPATGE